MGCIINMESKFIDIIEMYRYQIKKGEIMKRSYAEFAPIFKVLSDETRLKIIDMLSCGEICACDILDGLSISQSTLSYHMKNLTDSGLVNARRDGAWMRYTLNLERIGEIKDFLDYITEDKEDCICKKCK